MKVQELMSIDLETCRSEDTLNRAAQIMWEHDCGVVPVVDNESRVVGMLTDRDICIAAYTQGLPLWQIPVSTACSHEVRSCKVNDSVKSAEAIMRTAKVHRIPVIDSDGKIVGIIALSDLAQHVHKPRSHGAADGLSYQSLASTMATISQPATEQVSTGPVRGRSDSLQAAPTA